MANIYYVINTTDFDNVNFVEIVQNPNTVRYSLDGSKFIIKRPVGVETDPTFINDGSVTPVGKYTHSEILTLLETAEWTNSEI